jgi:diguanylate cyclase
MILTVDGWLALLAAGVALLASDTALRLARCLAISPRSPRLVCRIAAGALAVGFGLWCAGAVGTLAAVAPQASSSVLHAFAALPILVAAQAGTLLLARGERSPLVILAGGALAAAGVCAAYQATVIALGAGALAGTPAQLVRALALAFAAASTAVWLNPRCSAQRSWGGALARVGAVLSGATAIAVAHPLTLAQTRIVCGTFCGSVPFSSAQLVATLLAVVALAVLAVTHVITFYEARLAARAGHYARELEEVHARLRYLATRDPLTGLPNWGLFKDRLVQAIGDTERPGRAIAVAVLDLDHFSSLNHSLGHGAGDWLLAEVARRVGAAIRPDHVLARLGSDEFAVLIDSIAARVEAEAVTKRILTVLKEPMWVNGAEVHVRPSIGVSVWPDDGRRPDDLLTHAEVAMDAAKERGGNEAQFFQSSMADSMQERLALENELRRGLSAGEFELWFQPVISVKTGRIVTAEALLRWHHPQRGVIGPNSFVPLAEETGLMIPLGEWVLRAACQHARAWQLRRGEPIRLAVNLSATLFRHHNLLELIRDALQAEQVDAECLEIELTESSVMTNPEESAAVLKQLRKMGITVAIDDFGTGYSSLSYLRRFSIDKLKIDRSFVGELTTSRTDESIVRAIIALAHSVGLQVVAEGVETEEQLRSVRALGCDQWQGYYCCRPQPAAIFADLLAEESGTRTALVAALTRVWQER